MISAISSEVRLGSLVKVRLMFPVRELFRRSSTRSIGQNDREEGVLKLDILAPGQDVMAVVAPNKPCMEVGIYSLVTDYVLYLGTSMAEPHVAGVVALIKSVYRDWSLAAIRSAIMTTAYATDNTH
ncbi:hypothetical protein IFM89_016482 [Coptis chinensis]|uniref:Peptidase S8/S53 domain-containing protein n=1 Tax=Coptis chinensis TaxID=261450 RepID=A0A835LUF8_9MAGN|nr:hypothetical protein IFM89_016482 [Coptis chinensis]